MCYGAVDRVVTSLLSDEVRRPAADIPVEEFLPSIDLATTLREWITFFVEKSVVQHISAFHSLQQTATKDIRHEYWDEMSKKSEVVSASY
jgi:hypothetical protein